MSSSSSQVNSQSAMDSAKSEAENAILRSKLEMFQQFESLISQAQAIIDYLARTTVLSDDFVRTCLDLMQEVTERLNYAQKVEETEGDAYTEYYSVYSSLYFQVGKRLPPDKNRRYLEKSLEAIDKLESRGKLDPPVEAIRNQVLNLLTMESSSSSSTSDTELNKTHEKERLLSIAVKETIRNAKSSAVEHYKRLIKIADQLIDVLKKNEKFEDSTFITRCINIADEILFRDTYYHGWEDHDKEKIYGYQQVRYIYTRVIMYAEKSDYLLNENYYYQCLAKVMEFLHSKGKLEDGEEQQLINIQNHFGRLSGPSSQNSRSTKPQNRAAEPLEQKDIAVTLAQTITDIQHHISPLIETVAKNGDNEQDDGVQISDTVSTLNDTTKNIFFLLQQFFTHPNLVLNAGQILELKQLVDKFISYYLDETADDHAARSAWSSISLDDIFQIVEMMQYFPIHLDGQPEKERISEHFLYKCQYFACLERILNILSIQYKVNFSKDKQAAIAKQIVMMAEALRLCAPAIKSLMAENPNLNIKHLKTHHIDDTLGDICLRVSEYKKNKETLWFGDEFDIEPSRQWLKISIKYYQDPNKKASAESLLPFYPEEEKTISNLCPLDVSQEYDQISQHYNTILKSVASNSSEFDKCYQIITVFYKINVLLNHLVRHKGIKPYVNEIIFDLYLSRLERLAVKVFTGSFDDGTKAEAYLKQGKIYADLALIKSNVGRYYRFAFIATLQGFVLSSSEQARVQLENICSKYCMSIERVVKDPTKKRQIYEHLFKCLNEKDREKLNTQCQSIYDKIRSDIKAKIGQETYPFHVRSSASSASTSQLSDQASDSIKGREDKKEKDQKIDSSNSSASSSSSVSKPLLLSGVKRKASGDTSQGRSAKHTHTDTSLIDAESTCKEVNAAIKTSEQKMEEQCDTLINQANLLLSILTQSNGVDVNQAFINACLKLLEELSYRNEYYGRQGDQTEVEIRYHEICGELHYALAKHGQKYGATSDIKVDVQGCYEEAEILFEHLEDIDMLLNHNDQAALRDIRHQLKLLKAKFGAQSNPPLSLAQRANEANLSEEKQVSTNSASSAGNFQAMIVETHRKINASREAMRQHFTALFMLSYKLISVLQSKEVAIDPSVFKVCSDFMDELWRREGYFDKTDQDEGIQIDYNQHLKALILSMYHYAKQHHLTFEEKYYDNLELSLTFLDDYNKLDEEDKGMLVFVQDILSALRNTSKDGLNNPASNSALKNENETMSLSTIIDKIITDIQTFIHPSSVIEQAEIPVKEEVSAKEEVSVNEGMSVKEEIFGKAEVSGKEEVFEAEQTFGKMETDEHENITLTSNISMSHQTDKIMDRALYIMTQFFKTTTLEVDEEKILAFERHVSQFVEFVLDQISQFKSSGAERSQNISLDKIKQILEMMIYFPISVPEQSSKDRLAENILSKYQYFTILKDVVYQYISTYQSRASGLKMHGDAQHHSQQSELLKTTVRFVETMRLYGIKIDKLMAENPQIILNQIVQEKINDTLGDVCQAMSTIGQKSEFEFEYISQISTALLWVQLAVHYYHDTNKKQAAIASSDTLSMLEIAHDNPTSIAANAPLENILKYKALVTVDAAIFNSISSKLSEFEKCYKILKYFSDINTTLETLLREEKVAPFPNSMIFELYLDRFSNVAMEIIRGEFDDAIKADAYFKLGEVHALKADAYFKLGEAYALKAQITKKEVIETYNYAHGLTLDGLTRVPSSLGIKQHERILNEFLIAVEKEKDSNTKIRWYNYTLVQLHKMDIIQWAPDIRESFQTCIRKVKDKIRDLTQTTANSPFPSGLEPLDRPLQVRRELFPGPESHIPMFRQPSDCLSDHKQLSVSLSKEMEAFMSDIMIPDPFISNSPEHETVSALLSLSAMDSTMSDEVATSKSSSTSRKRNYLHGAPRDLKSRLIESDPFVSNSPEHETASATSLLPSTDSAVSDEVTISISSSSKVDSVVNFTSKKRERSSTESAIGDNVTIEQSSPQKKLKR